MTGTLILNTALSAAVAAVILSMIGWAVATAGRDSEAMARRLPRRRAKVAPHASPGRASGQAWSSSSSSS